MNVPTAGSAFLGGHCAIFRPYAGDSNAERVRVLCFQTQGELERLGVDPVVKRAPRREPPSAAYPFNFLIHRPPMHRMTESGSNPLINELFPENYLSIHPAPAAKLGIADGDR